VCLSAKTAADLGIKVKASDPTLETTVADGRKVESRLVTIQSIQLGPFTVQNVQCLIDDSGGDQSPDLLGGTFQNHFLCKLDAQAGILHLTPSDKSATVSETNNASDPAQGTSPQASQQQQSSPPEQAVAPPPPPDEGKFTDPQQLVDAVSPNLWPPTADGWTQLKLEAINDAFHKQVNGNTGTFTITVDKVQPDHSSNRGTYLVIAKATVVGKLPVWSYFFFDDDKKDKLASLNHGDTITVTGKLNPVAIEQQGSVVALQIAMAHCDVAPSK
jgi:hypothetical protein